MKKRQTTNKKSNKDQKKEKKQKEPKQYIPAFLIQDLREPTLITTPEDCDNENEATKNYSPDYKPEFIVKNYEKSKRYLNKKTNENNTEENNSTEKNDKEKNFDKKNYTKYKQKKIINK